MSFFKKWLQGTKDYAGSQTGMVETQLIISIFLTLGLLLGTVERHLEGDGIFAFILFALFLLQLIGLIGIYKLYKQLRMQDKMIKKLKQGDDLNGEQGIRSVEEGPSYVG